MAVHTDRGVRTFIATTSDEVLAMGDPTRTRILNALRWQPASAKRLSEHLEMTHGRVGHHLKILEKAGFVELAEERQVRGLTERIYRTTFDYVTVQLDDPTFNEVRFFFQLCGHLTSPSTPTPIARCRRLHVTRMTRERATEYAQRLQELADEFAQDDEDNGEMFALAGAVFRTDPVIEP